MGGDFLAGDDHRSIKSKSGKTAIDVPWKRGVFITGIYAKKKKTRPGERKGFGFKKPILRTELSQETSGGGKRSVRCSSGWNRGQVRRRGGTVRLSQEPPRARVGPDEDWGGRKRLSLFMKTKKLI